MPNIMHRLSYETHASLLVDRKLLAEVLTEAFKTGWTFYDCDIEAHGNREISLKAIEELSQIPPYVLETVQDLRLTFKPTGDSSLSPNWASIKFRPSNLARKPFEVWITGINEGAVLELKSFLERLVKVRRQWYSPLSRNLWYFICYLFVAGSNVLLGLFGHFAHRNFALSSLVDKTLAVVGLIIVIMGFFRQRVFPGCDFNLTDPPAEKTRSQKLRALLSKILFGTIGVAVAGALVRHIFG